ncbi:MAG TPA: hypothetical protein VES19_05345 [Candidatus Limnocylindrales bacterium]|nr:hypothetical protein [Candidatus Limnocylindrales bacterium]
MPRETLMRLVRRAVVVAGTVAVIGVAVGTVQVAADWRAAAAPLDTAPVSLTTIEQEYATENERADDLAAQMDGVATQISTLQAALITANGSIAGDTANATDLQKQLAAAKDKLTSIQKQLGAAQDRLEALNRAAARQAAANRAGSKSSSGGGGGGGGDDDGGEEEDDD